MVDGAGLDIRRPESQGGDFKERFWGPVTPPVLDETGRVDPETPSPPNDSL